jgi:adenosylhomocysteine nucleosidase
MTQSQKPRTVFIAALPREISGLVNGWRADEVLPGRHIHLYWNDQAVVACAGMGAQRARLAVEAALALGPASELVSVGWAGACIHRLHVGDVFWPDVVVDVQTGERFLPTKERARHEGLEILATVPVPAGTAEKERLGESYFASAVDMEAAAVGRLAQIHDLPFSAIKAISDEANDELPGMERFVTPQGHLREMAFGLHVAIRPALWKPVGRLARGSKLAADNLQGEIKNYLQSLKAKK